MDVNDVVSSCNSCCYMYQVYPTPPDLILQKAVSAETRQTSGSNCPQSGAINWLAFSSSKYLGLNCSTLPRKMLGPKKALS